MQGEVVDIGDAGGWYLYLLAGWRGTAATVRRKN